MVHPNKVRDVRSKRLQLATQSVAFFIPLVLAAAYLNMGQTCCSGNCPPPAPEFRVSIHNGWPGRSEEHTSELQSH